MKKFKHTVTDIALILVVLVACVWVLVTAINACNRTYSNYPVHWSQPVFWK